MLHIGIDLHKRFSEIAVLDDAGTVIDRCSIRHENREALVQFLTKFGSDVVVTVEATRNWYWLLDLIESLGLKRKLAHSRKVRLIAECKKKSDKVDARTLAELERVNYLPEAYVPRQEIRDQREWLRYRIALVRTRTRLKNRIHAVLDKHGIIHAFTDLFGTKGLAYLQTVGLRPVYRQELNQLLELIQELDKKINAATRQIREVLKPDERAHWLLTIPGVGQLTAYLLLYEIGDIRRFNSARELCGYAGITPIVRESGDHRQEGHISKEGNPYIRWDIVEAAQIARRKDPALYDFYGRIARKRGPHKAIVAVGRKLLVAVWTVLTYGVPYRYNILARPVEPGRRPLSTDQEDWPASTTQDDEPEA
jgi:transposase